MGILAILGREALSEPDREVRDGKGALCPDILAILGSEALSESITMNGQRGSVVGRVGRLTHYEMESPFKADIDRQASWIAESWCWS
jgi:hypothetical protein